MHAFSLQSGGNLKQHEIILGEKDIVIKPGRSGDGIDLKSAKEAFMTALSANQEITITLPIKPASPTPVDVDALYESIFKEAKDSHYSKEGNALKIVPHVVGRDFDKEAARVLVSGITEGGDNVVIRIREITPPITTASLSTGLFKDVLGTLQATFPVQ